ncbi:MAG: NAD(P)H-hydrate epimerase [Candidatus Nomurabacteria bacterium]|nr:MAG: NAD(P)H-hydrate epimerase [Candidatus Nomurabacteria bacterium]
MEIPYITTDQMREVDHLMIQYFRIDLLQMMENAGRNLAEIAKNEFFAGDSSGRKVIVLAGTGGNGGGGLAAARHLQNHGAQVTIVLATSKYGLSKTTRRQLDILEEIGLNVVTAQSKLNFDEFDLIIDALIGYSLTGNPEDEYASLITTANSSNTPILSLDTPSGLDTTSGQSFNPCIRADITMTLALPKTGFKSTTAKEYLGKLYLADIGVPPELYKMIEIEVPKNIFTQSFITKL